MTFLFNMQFPLRIVDPQERPELLFDACLRELAMVKSLFMEEPYLGHNVHKQTHVFELHTFDFYLIVFKRTLCDFN